VYSNSIFSPDASAQSIMDLGDIGYVLRTSHTRHCISQHTHSRCPVDHHERRGVRRLGMYGAYIQAVGRPSWCLRSALRCFRKFVSRSCHTFIRSMTSQMSLPLFAWVCWHVCSLTKYCNQCPQRVPRRPALGGVPGRRPLPIGDGVRPN